MPVVCPTVLADNDDAYHAQMAKIADFAERIQIDLADGRFAPVRTVQPEQAWWPVGVRADFHLMYQDPTEAVREIMQHKPNLIIVHAEADGDFTAFADLCHSHGVGVGVALLPQTRPEAVLPALNTIDHILIFSGDLGHFGGHADLGLTDKIKFLKSHKQDLEIGWDGGIDVQNVARLVYEGVDVLNVGGFIQQAENPYKAYDALQRIADETGTT